MNCAHNILLSNGGGYPPHATPNRASLVTDGQRYTPDVRLHYMRSTHRDHHLHALNEVSVSHLKTMDSGSPLPIIRMRRLERIVLRFAQEPIGIRTPGVVRHHEFNRESSARLMNVRVETSSGGKDRFRLRYQTMESNVFKQRDAVKRSLTCREKEKNR